MNKYAHLAPKTPSADARRCLTKKRYRDREQALAAAEKLLAKGRVLTPYRFALCLRFHLTSAASA